MTDLEFRIIDELYFVSSFKTLQAECGLAPAQLSETLQQLLEAGFVKAFFPDPDTEVSPAEAIENINLRNCFFLATKAGLLAHNSN